MSIVSFLAVPSIIIAAAVIVVSLFLHFVPIGLWISAMAAGVSVGIVNLIGMRLRRVIPSKIILPLVKANKAGLDVNVNQLEAHYLAGGDVDRVVDALIAAHRATMSLTFERACAIDLAGRDVLEAVQMSVNPKVIETPFISAVAQNGIELKVRARSRSAPTSTASSAVPVKRRSSPASAKASSPASARHGTIHRSWRTLTKSVRPSSARASTPGRLLKSCPSTLLTST